MKRMLLTAALLLATPAWAADTPPGPQRNEAGARVVKRPIDYDRVNRILDAEIMRQSRQTRCVGIDFGGGISTLTCN